MPAHQLHDQQHDRRDDHRRRAAEHAELDKARHNAHRRVVKALQLQLLPLERLFQRAVFLAQLHALRLRGQDRALIAVHCVLRVLERIAPRLLRRLHAHIRVGVVRVAVGRDRMLRHRGGNGVMGEAHRRGQIVRDAGGQLSIRADDADHKRAAVARRDRHDLADLRGGHVRQRKVADHLLKALLVGDGDDVGVDDVRRPVRILIDHGREDLIARVHAEIAVGRAHLIGVDRHVDAPPDLRLLLVGKGGELLTLRPLALDHRLRRADLRAVGRKRRLRFGDLLAQQRLFLQPLLGDARRVVRIKAVDIAVPPETVARHRAARQNRGGHGKGQNSTPSACDGGKHFP